MFDITVIVREVYRKGVGGGSPPFVPAVMTQLVYYTQFKDPKGFPSIIEM